MKTIIKDEHNVLILEPDQPKEHEVMERMFPPHSRKVRRRQKTDHYGQPSGGFFYEIHGTQTTSEEVNHAD